MIACGSAAAQANGPDAAVQQAAAAQKQPLLDTLKDLVGIETGSRDYEGLTRSAELIAAKLRALGGQVEVIEPQEATTYRMADTPPKIGRMVRATFQGTGSKRILLLAHMDTVYLKGMLAKQPFRIDGNRAYGLGIADEKQGVALALHTVALLKALHFQDYGTLTVLVNGDEEISSPGSRSTITETASRQDAVLSFEATRIDNEKLSLATSGIGAVQIHVEGRASHAGGAPERGVNALYELSHQVLQMRDLSNPDTGVKMNWTIAQAGTNRNVIPADAKAEADVRVLRVADYDGLEATVRERAKQQLLPEAKVTVKFERRRPPLEATDASRRLAAQAQAIYGEVGRKLEVVDRAEGGGTDAAFAALQTKAPVIEHFGLPGYGAHSANDEYVLVDAIEPRLYLVARVVMDVAKGKGL
ncbi:M20/M25/M40 family metallo-hydrolase [Ramlibacter sp. G-1-2-2]|uniref:M20/M25/M40 family metallo-hydrolase n=2 Tax=Ramlibacter agri TaxID=2728837 RepID=A0A848HCE9_9BURK|nr:M20/M25/M40 family metallo-hydrolase [Ramlibacter agri]